MGIFKRDFSKKELKSFEPIVNKINAYYDEFKNLSDEELQQKTQDFKERVNNGESLDSILPEAFAVVKSASTRTIGLTHFDVQLMGGISLHRGEIAEQATGEGKANPNSTPIPTPDGWKTVGDIKVGDYLFDRSGKPTKVLNVFPQGKIDTYELKLVDGRCVKCAAEHLWSVYSTNNMNELETMDTLMLKMGLEHGKDTHFYLPITQPVQYEEKYLPVNPYHLGRDIGNRCSNLRDNDIFIPNKYKLSSINQRFELLQGMLDVWGYIDNDDIGNNYINFITTSDVLRNDILEVLYSLGCKCSYSDIKYNFENSYVIKIDVPDNIKKKLFKHPKESIKDVLDNSNNTSDDYGIVEIESVRKLDEQNEQTCFVVDNDEHLFLIGGYVVTHNTLTATCPAYLNALDGKGVHIVTVNDYLAKRDADEMGKIFRFLGLSVGCVVSTSTLQDRQKAYASDITYITNKELAFDYLRDNMVVSKNQLTGNRFHYGIIDEIDSILIDEARTPFIISEKSEDSAKKYFIVNAFVKRLERGEDLQEKGKMEYIFDFENEDIKGDFRVDEKNQTVILTKNGIKKAERFFKVKNLSDVKNIDLMHYILTCLKAHYLMVNEKNYLVKDGQVFVVDEFTGRIMEGRRFNNGLHQAIEAKEGVKIKEDSKTIASITFQNLFNRYEKKCGMTGTAMTEEREFKEIYDLRVVAIPTNKPCIRVDKDDVIYKNHQAKLKRIVQEVQESYEKGQPVLVGTATIEQSEEISALLNELEIPHNVLNAKYHEKEAEIVSHAGEYKAVTIATNMAGRGTDIKLDETTKSMGLKIVGTNRHESRRIDNQLRGRSGRQGDKGETIFVLSLDDEIIRLFGGEIIKTLVNSLNLPDDAPLIHPMISKNVARSQKIVEGNNYEIRKRLYDYDLILNEQCEIIYKQRAEVLNNERIHENILEMIKDVVDEIISNHDKDGLDILSIREQLGIIFNLDEDFVLNDKMNGRDVFNYSIEKINEKYKGIQEFFEDDDAFSQFENVIFLKIVDKLWENHINTMTELRKSIGLQSYANKDPLVEYKIIGGDLFEDMLNQIKINVCTSLFNSTITKEETVEETTEYNNDGENEENVDDDKTPSFTIGDEFSIETDNNVINDNEVTLLQN